MSIIEPKKMSVMPSNSLDTANSVPTMPGFRPTAVSYTHLKPAIDEHKHQLEVHIEHIEHEAVCGDSLRIQQDVYKRQAIYSTRWAMSSGPMRVKSYRWQRERMVAGTFWISVVARMKMTWAGGSSSVFSSALKAAEMCIRDRFSVFPNP